MKLQVRCTKYNVPGTKYNVPGTKYNGPGSILMQEKRLVEDVSIPLRLCVFARIKK